MALTKIVSKKSVTYSQENLWSITLNLKVSDGVSNVIDKDFSVEFRKGEDVVNKTAEIKEKMQKAIDDYKSSLVIFNSVKLDNAVSDISGGLIL